MIIYHVSLNIMEDRIKLFTPRIPWATSDEEDIETPRICVSPSIVGCCSGIGYDSAFQYGTEIIVYEAGIATEKLIPPSVLVKRYNVLDAIYTEEHWCLEPITMVGHLYRITYFERDNYLLPISKQSKDIREYLYGKIGQIAYDADYSELLNEIAPAKGVDEDELVDRFGIPGIRVFTKIKLEVVDETTKG